jgi:hypothetical protein
MRYLKPIVVLCLAASLAACSSGAARLATATLPPATLPSARALTTPTHLYMGLLTATPAATPLRPATPPTRALPTPTMTAITLQRPAQPQIGLNFIRFYWTDSQSTQLNTTTPYWQPAWIFNDFAALRVHVFRQFVKGDLLWDIVEPRDNQWNWQAADVVLKNPNFEPIVTLFRMQYGSPTPPWATRPAQFQKNLGPEATDYVETVVKRYAPYVKYWELGNEMDHWRAADPGEKAPSQQKLPEARPADGFSPREQGVFFGQVAALIRENDPDAVIVMPGMSGLDDYLTNTWLPGVIEGGGKDWFDIVNYHYYSSWERYPLLRSKFQETLKRLGIDGKPVWMTETGSTSSATLTIRTNYPNSTESQAADIFRRIVQAWGHGDALAMWHTYIGSAATEDNEWRGYGIRTEQGDAQPAYYALQLLTSELVPFTRVEKLSADAKRVNAYKITAQAGAVKYVVWGNGNYTVPAGVTQMASVIPKADGSFLWQAVPVGRAIPLSPDPVLLK